MSVLLYLLGVLSALGGAAAIVFGIPVKEFSFGNTLILAGTTGLVGGLVVIGLAAAISELRRMGEMLGARPLSRAGRLEPFDAPAKIPFPPKPKAQRREAAAVEPAPMAPVPSAVEEPKLEPEFTPPSLRNPDVPLMAEEEAQELPLSPRPGEAAAVERDDFASERRAPENTEQASFEPVWRSPSKHAEPGYFDKMWPAGERTPPPTERGASWSDSAPRPAAPEPEPPQDEAPPVAILKSGVVDGMGYTLYVDGSIEADLPSGTLRFASITELRKHLERNSSSG